jgi:hypothetical protein
MAKKKIEPIKIKKLRTNYELRFDYLPILTTFIKTLPREHRSVRVDNVLDVKGGTRDEWVRIIREVQMGNVISFLVDNSIPFVFENILPEELNNLRREYLNRQKRVSEALKLKGVDLSFDDMDFSFMKKQPYDYQKQAVKFFEINEGKAILGDQPGVGKQAPLYTLISTPNGWVKMGDINIGDKIHNRFGGISVVKDIFPQGVQESYKITFNDNSYTECGLEHLWSVRDKNRRQRNKGWTTKSLKQIIESGLEDKMTPSRLKSGRAPSLKWEVPVVEPVFYEEKDFLIHPYVLGALIGDGCTCLPSKAVISISNFQQEISEMVKKNLPDGYCLNKYQHKNSCDRHAIVKNEDNKNFNNSVVKELVQMKLNVKSGKKFIPDSYKNLRLNKE